MTISVWHNAETQAFKLHQLSGDPEDGTGAEQIAHISTLAAFAGFRCVSEGYKGAIPNAPPATWRWDGSEIISVAVPPKSVTPRQVRLVLEQQGLLSQVEEMIAAQDKATRITWEYALEFNRDDPLLKQLGVNLGLTPGQIDQFFIAASNL